jgi:hypothetical protein
MKLAFKAPFLAAASLVLVSCGQYSKGYDGPPTYYEIEDNDDAWNANFIEYADASTHVEIRGHVQAFGFDRFDGFAFVTSEPMTVHFQLRADDAFTDLDLCVYDPGVDDFVDCFDSAWSPEDGSFAVLAAGQEFHLVVESYAFDSDYTLEVWGEPIFLQQAAPESGTYAASEASPFVSENVLSDKEPEMIERRESYKRSAQVVVEPAPERVVRRGQVYVKGPNGELEATPFAVTSRGKVLMDGR